MPYSDQVFNPLLGKLLELLVPRSVLDVGAGAGRYGKLVRSHSPDATTTALEVEGDYITKFGLGSLYDEVLEMRVQELIAPSFYERNFDLVIFGDVIEHLKKSEGTDIVNFLLYRSAWLLVSYPIRYIQNSVRGYNSEAHLSAWGSGDFGQLDSTRTLSVNGIELVCIKGYLEHPVALGEVDSLLAGEA